MNFEVANIRVKKPCKTFIHNTSLFTSDVNKQTNTFRNFCKDNYFLTIVSSLDYNFNGEVNVFEDDRLLLKIKNEDTHLYFSSVSISSNFIAIGSCNNSQGNILIYNLNGELIDKIIINKPFFGKKICLDNNFLYTYFYENNKITILKYFIKYEYYNSKLSVIYNLLKEVVIDEPSLEVNFSINENFLILGLPNTNIGKVIILDKNLEIKQQFIPHDIVLSADEYRNTKYNGYGGTIDSSFNFLVVGAPCLKTCTDYNNKECYKGAVYIYRFNSEEKKYYFFDKINNPRKLKDDEDDELYHFFSTGLTIKNNNLYIGDSTANNIKGCIYKYELNYYFNNNEDKKLVNTDTFITNENNIFGIGYDISINKNNYIISSSFEDKGLESFNTIISIFKE